MWIIIIFALKTNEMNPQIFKKIKIDIARLLKYQLNCVFDETIVTHQLCRGTCAFVANFAGNFPTVLTSVHTIKSDLLVL